MTRMNMIASTLGIGMVAALVALPAASADPTTVCALDPFPPCVTYDLGSTAGDGDCDESNGSGAVSHSVTAWTGTYPAGNNTVQAANDCNGPYGSPGAHDQTYVYGRFYAPGSTSTFARLNLYWSAYSSGSCSAAMTQPVSQDLRPYLCPLGEPPTIPALP